MDAREQELLAKLSNDELQDQIDEAIAGLGSPQKAKLVREYVKCGFDVYKAGVAAGYGKNSKAKDPEKKKLAIQQVAGRVLKEPAVDRAVKLIAQQMNRSCIVDVDWWLRENVQFYKECREVIEIKDDQGEVLGKSHVDAKSASAALDRIGKHLGAYKPVQVELGVSKTLVDLLKEIDGRSTGIPGGS